MKPLDRWVGGMVLVVLSGIMVATLMFVESSRGQQAPTTQPGGGGRGRGGGRGPSLGGDMRSMDQAFNSVMAQYKDSSKNDSTLSLLGTFESQAALAKAALPPTLRNMPEADQKKATDEYRVAMRKLIRASLDLEDEITAGDLDKAAATITMMQDIEKSGHKEFRPGQY